MRMASVRVAVRARPLNTREMGLQTPSVVTVEKNVMRLVKPKAAELTASMTALSSENGRPPLMTSSVILPATQALSPGTSSQDAKDFTFDYCFWSCIRSDQHYAGQEDVYRAFGADVVTAAYQGYNTCVFAYGQTGSGKTYTMTGNDQEPGLIPRICRQLFSRMESKELVSYRTTVSYMEIYNEKVLDLLKKDRKGSTTNPNSTTSLRVREHPKKGPYVQDLSHHIVSDYNDIQELMNKGNRQRHTASTKMNDTSSRSHAIFTIVFTQAKFSQELPEEKFSKIHLVDLAGSERAQATGATGQRLKEGGSINRSLVLLGNVISSLAEKSTNKKVVFVPYRDSVLTWLLKDSLGGNSKTMMIATVSPAACNYSETLSTLRYASRAKSIINRPEVNEDSNVKVIRELRAEIAWLRQRLSARGDKADAGGVGDRVAERLQENEARVAVLTQAWTDRWRATVSVLEEEGELDLRRTNAGQSGIVLDSKTPYLARISADSVYSTGLELFQLKLGENHVGSDDTTQTIVLRGSGIQPEHCCITMEQEEAEGKEAKVEEEAEAEADVEAQKAAAAAAESVVHRVMLRPLPGALCAINNVEVEGPQPLLHGCHVIFGDVALFRFNNPAEAQRMQREGISKPLLPPPLLDVSKLDDKLAEEVESEQKLIEKRRELAELEERYLQTEQHFHQEAQKKEKELEAKRRRLEELQSCLEATRTRLDTKTTRARRSSFDLERLRNCNSPAELFHLVQSDLEVKFEGILSSELAKLGEESRRLEERRAAALAQFAEEEAALRRELEAKREEREAAHREESEVSGLQQDLAMLDVMLGRNEITAQKHTELHAAVVAEVAAQTAQFAALEAALNELAVRVPAQLQAVKERREAWGQEASEAARDLELRECALRRDLRERFNRELADLVEELVRSGVEGPPAEERKESESEECDVASGASSAEDFPKENLVDAEKEVMTLQVEVQAVEESLRAHELVIADEQESVEWKRWQVQELEDSRRLSVRIEAEVSRRIALAKEQEEARQRAEAEWREAEREAEEEAETAAMEAEIEAARERARSEREEEEERRRHVQRLREEKAREEAKLRDQMRHRALSPSSASSSSEDSGRILRPSVSTHHLGAGPSASYFRTRSLHSLNMTDAALGPMVDVNITICRYLRRQDYMEYEIQCRVGLEEWSVCRRYSRIRQFHDELRRQYPEIKSISFPSRTPFWVNSRAEAVAESRVTELQNYFQKVVNYLSRHQYCLLNPTKSRVPICKRIVCQVLPILQKGEFETNRFGTA